MANIKGIILKGVKNEKFEEIFYNKKETDINELKTVISKIKNKREGKINDNDNICYFKTFLPNDKSQSFLYIIYCHKSNLEENIEECFDEIIEILNNIYQFNSFTLNKFPTNIKDKIKIIFNKHNNFHNNVSNLIINDITNDEIRHNDDNLIENNNEPTLHFSLIKEEKKIIKKDNISYFKNVKVYYLIICILLFIGNIIFMRKFIK